MQTGQKMGEIADGKAGTALVDSWVLLEAALSDKKMELREFWLDEERGNRGSRGVRFREKWKQPTHAS